MADSEKILGVANRIASTHEDGNQVVVGGSLVALWAWSRLSLHSFEKFLKASSALFNSPSHFLTVSAALAPGTNDSGGSWWASP